MKREKKMLMGNVKGEFTFNFDGNIVPIKKVDMAKKPGLKQVIP
jgi:hypothetical protein